MPCPYAERKGLLVWCKLRKKFVNPLTRPCITGNYALCPDYRADMERVAKPVEQRAAEKPRLVFEDRYSARLTDPLYMAVLIARSEYVDSVRGKPRELLEWALGKAVEEKINTARVDIACPEEGWNAVLLLEDGRYVGVFVETRDGEKLAGLSAWNMIRGSECNHAVAMLYRVRL